MYIRRCVRGQYHKVLFFGRKVRQLETDEAALEGRRLMCDESCRSANLFGMTCVVQTPTEHTQNASNKYVKSGRLKRRMDCVMCSRVIFMRHVCYTTGQRTLGFTNFHIVTYSARTYGDRFLL